MIMGLGEIRFDDYFYLRARWELKFSWLPRRCDRTGELIWLQWAYRGIHTLTGPDLPFEDHRWVTRDEWVIEKLKGTI